MSDSNSSVSKFISLLIILVVLGLIGCSAEDSKGQYSLKITPAFSDHVEVTKNCGKSWYIQSLGVERPSDYSARVTVHSPKNYVKGSCGTLILIYNKGLEYSAGAGIVTFADGLDAGIKYSINVSIKDKKVLRKSIANAINPKYSEPIQVVDFTETDAYNGFFSTLLSSKIEGYANQFAYPELSENTLTNFILKDPDIKKAFYELGLEIKSLRIEIILTPNSEMQIMARTARPE